jgi:hypothetical protein
MSPSAGGYIIVDWLGDWNGDPGSGWAVAGVSNGTKDHTLVRKCSVTQGNTDWTLSAGTSVANSEWEVFPQNTWTAIGSHTSPCTGCTDSLATNYNPIATVDDGSCLYGMPGCTDSTAMNYNPLATVDDGSCTYCVYGCIDSTACNYDSLAICDDGSCLYGIAGCTDPTALNYDSLATCDDGSCTYPAANLYFSEYAEGTSNNKYFEVYNASNDTVDLTGYAYPSVGNAPNTPGVYEYWNEFDAGASVAPGDVYVVAHPYADPAILAEADETHLYLSNGDDGYALVYGSDPGAPVGPAAGGYTILDWLGDWNGDPGSGWDVAGVSAATKDHTLVRKCDVAQGNTNWTLSAGTTAANSEWEVFPQNTWTAIGSHDHPCSGCTDSLACNYNPAAVVDDGSCLTAYGCTNPAACNYDSLATCDDGSCLTAYGCTNPAACNYDSTATCDDGSCLTVYGCMDTLACNYDPSATCDDGSCLTAYGCMDTTALNYNASATCDDGSCTYCVYGCMDQSQFNYNPLATCDDGSCIPIIYGCTDPLAINYYAAANTNNGTCVYCTYGCTNPLAANYNPLATCDDGSCLYGIPGCMDSTALNYNPLATVDDGTCTYSTACTSPVPTGLSVTELTHDRAKINWGDANTSLCLVEMYRVQYREQGTTAWSTKTALGSGLCNFGLTTTSKRLWNLTASTVYEYRVKAWYCSSSASTWSSIATFTTLDPCPNINNFAVSTPTNTRATFTWTAPTAPYSFVRIKLRVDTTGSAWLTAGGFGVMYPALTRNKNGLVAGESYRASSRTWCNPLGGPHKALAWSPFIYWTQPGGSIRIDGEGSTAITNLEVYPNPSRDIFNVSFVSDEVQNLDISITNVVGEAIYNADLEQFVGQFTKEVSLATYPKGVYFLQITTDKGVVTKKLTLQ